MAKILEINIPEVVAEVTEAFKRYEQALITNDVRMLDTLFWSSPLTIRYGATENLYGYIAIQEFRAKRSSSGLMRTLRNTVITTFGRDMATTNTEFTRVNTTKIGRQSHSWVRTPDGWRLVAAHVSLMDAGTD